MAQKKQAKMGHRGAGRQHAAAGEKVNHTVGGGVLNGFTIMNSEGEVVARRENMWSAIELRKTLDAS